LKLAFDNERGPELTRIRFAEVTQRYRVIRERSDTLREAFTRLARRQTTYSDFAALKRVSFEIGDGEVVGIIGHNGSGKSTILKIIAGVYKPTAGVVETAGKVAALIELGAGFHMDMTGRENILLNGLLLGLTKREIRAKEERIIAFAELGDFIDSPIKQYSSGMLMRLGFSIATEVDPEILLIDEILAVGDAEFQAKCAQRIEEICRRGKTIIFVSHDLNAVRQLCGRVLLMDHGVLVADGPAREVISLYEGSHQNVQYGT
jgi:ABC-type polysaccharide/polyol phosphate transport system ATPase subunit